MFNFLHTFSPEPILISIGPINVYWYGLFVILGFLAAIFVTTKLASYHKIEKNIIIDLSFWLILGGLIGARIYHVFLELPYYLDNPLNVFKFWQGGLAIHGGLIAGIIILYFYAKKFKIDFWLIAALLTPGLALAQAIGRWGNYFNQELFGKPTDLAWGIPINLLNRPLEYISFEYFHPTFLYESIGNLVIFFALLGMHILIIKRRANTTSYQLTAASYLVLYSILRFSLEFIRIDTTPELLDLRFPQIISLVILFLIIFAPLLAKIKKT